VVDDLGEMAGGFCVEARLQSGHGGGPSAEQELDVAEDVRDELGLAMEVWGAARSAASAQNRA
jgi:hypothetical protein